MAGARQTALGMATEFMGGDHDVADEEIEAEGDLVPNVPMLHALLNLDKARELLARDAEIAAARLPGRHRDADTQMKMFADRFGDRLRAQIPTPASDPSMCAPPVLNSPLGEALAHQRAVRAAMKKKPRGFAADGGEPGRCAR